MEWYLARNIYENANFMTSPHQMRQVRTFIRSVFRRGLALYLCFTFVGGPAIGQQGGTGGPRREGTQQDFLIKNQELQGYTGADEFYAESVPGEILVAINLLGSVRRSGIYHLPKQTDIIHLISLSGGITDQADLSRVTIKRRNKERERVILVNLEDIFQRPGTLSPVLESGDVVMIAVKEPPVSASTITLIGLISSIISIIVSGLLLSKSLSRN